VSIPESPGVRVTAGVDWAKDDHVVCVVGEQGEVIERFTVANDAAGLKQMTRRLLRAGVEQVGIERGDGLLLAALTIFVIPPSQVKNLRSRYGSAGNKDDRFDAYVLADVVRTDARRLRGDGVRHRADHDLARQRACTPGPGHPSGRGG
jgi:transposase